jgi:DNA repair exonuclease SbcCD ATPase subunit
VYVLENVIPVLNSRVNYYLSILFSGNDWKVTFDKHLNENISRNGVMGLNYNMNSQGERRRIDLALSFAIFDVLRMQYGTVSNVLFFDEVFDTGLDGVGTQKVYEVLRNSKMPTIFVISHKETLVDNFDNVLEVTCEKGLSRVTQK